MIFALMFACIPSKTSLTGIIDNSSQKKCIVELNTGELVLIESNICGASKEGDKVIFYVRKK